MLASPFAWMVRVGIIDVFIPFIIFFIVLFALLQRANLFSERRLNATISLALSLLIVVPHATGRYPANADPIIFLNNILPGAGVLTIVILLALMMLGLVGARFFSPSGGMIGILGLIALAGIILNAIRPLRELQFLNDPALQSAVIVILVFGLVVWYVMGEDRYADETIEERRRRIRDGWRAWFGV